MSAVQKHVDESYHGDYNHCEKENVHPRILLFSAMISHVLSRTFDAQGEKPLSGSDGIEVTGP